MNTEEKTIYINETHSLYEENGELHIYGDFGEIVWNCESLFTDLPHIVGLVIKARQETDERFKEDIINITQSSRL